MRKEKEKEEEEIRHVWPFYVLSLNPSKQKKSSKTGNQCNQYKQPTVNGSAVTGMLVMLSPAGVPNAVWEAAGMAEMRDVIPLYGKVYHFWQVDQGFHNLHCFILIHTCSSY